MARTARSITSAAVTSTPVRSWWMRFGRSSKLPFTLEQDPALLRTCDEPVIAGDTTKFRSCSGWKPEIGLSQTISDMIEWWRNHLTPTACFRSNSQRVLINTRWLLELACDVSERRGAVDDGKRSSAKCPGQYRDPRSIHGCVSSGADQSRGSFWFRLICRAIRPSSSAMAEARRMHSISRPNSWGVTSGSERLCPLLL